MMSVDLPAPPKRIVTPEESALRKWNALQAFLWLVTGYVLLHKGLIPAILKFTALQGTSYAKIDLWFIHPILLLLAIRSQNGVAKLGSFLAGGGIASAIIEIHRVWYGEYIGWVGVSHLLSSVPFGLICVVLLTSPAADRNTERSALAAWLGVILATVVRALLPILGAL